jgi:methyl-accepting chemotaxis protein
VNELVTGFEVDGQRIALEQVKATNALAKAMTELTRAVEDLAEVIEQNAPPARR